MTLGERFGGCIPLAHLVCSEPDDDDVLALAAQVGMIVSDDDDLLVLGNFDGIPVVNAAEALQRALPAVLQEARLDPWWPGRLVEPQKNPSTGT